MTARHTPSPKENSLALLTHMTYYLCGRPKKKKVIILKINNSNKLFYKILWPKFQARTDDSTISAHSTCSPYYLPPFLTQFVVIVCVGTFFAEFAECRLFFLLLSHGIVSTALVGTSMVVKRRFSREVAVKFSRNDAYSVHLRRGYKEQQWAPGWYSHMPTCSWLI